MYKSSYKSQGTIRSLEFMEFISLSNTNLLFSTIPKPLNKKKYNYDNKKLYLGKYYT